MSNYLQSVNLTSYSENINDVTIIGLFTITSMWISLFLNVFYSKFKCFSNFIPFTVNLLLLGILSGLLYKYDFFGKENNWSSPLGDSIYNWINLDPHILLHIFIPPLIFESASTIDHHIFMHSFSQSFILAVPGVIINILLISLFTNAIEGSWPIFTSLTFGSILAATDPVAVVSLLKDIGAPKQLGTLIEGESLLNDGVAFVFFTIFNHISNGLIKFNILYVIYQLFYTSIVGSLIGYILGLFCMSFISNFYNNSITVITASIAGCWGCFYISESLHVSGVLALVNFGLQFSKSLKTTVSLEVQENMHIAWEILGYMANTIVFIYSGIVISNFVQFSDLSAWINLLYLYISLQIIRTLSIGILYKCLKNDGYGLNFREFIILSWSGLRGAVGLILGLIIVNDEINVFSDKIMFYITGIVFLSMIINATTTKYIVECLKLNLSSASSEKMYNNIVDHLKEFITNEFESSKNNLNYVGADFDLIYSKLPLNIPKYSIEDINLSSEIEKLTNHINCNEIEINNFLLTELRRKYLTFMRINTLYIYDKKTHERSSVFQHIEHSIDVVEDYIYNPESNNLNLHFLKIVHKYCNYDNIINSVNYLGLLPNCISKILKFWFLQRKISFAFDLSTKLITIITKTNQSFENYVSNELCKYGTIPKIIELKNDVINDISELTYFLYDFNSTLSNLNIVKNIKTQFVLDDIIKKSHNFIHSKLHFGEINQKEHDKIKEHLQFYNLNKCLQGLSITKDKYNLSLFDSIDKRSLHEIYNNITEDIYQPGDIIVNENTELTYIYIIAQGEVNKIKTKMTNQQVSAKKIQKFVRHKLNLITNLNYNRGCIRKFSSNNDNINYEKETLYQNDIINENCLHISSTLSVVYKLDKQIILNLCQSNENLKELFKL